MVFYFGQRLLDSRNVWKIQDGFAPEPLDPRVDIWEHSPDGFNWGYGGSGPAQLALALLADATSNDAVAIALYQRFKDRVVAGMREDIWILSSAWALEWVMDNIGHKIDELVELYQTEGFRDGD